jgi:peptidoglycan hydrolase CwlO-like protein
MSEEEMNRKMELIVEQQAQFVTDIHKLGESQQELATRQGTLTDALMAVVGMVGKLTEGQEELRSEAKELAAAQRRTDEKLTETNAKLGETNERMNIFIDVLERYVSEGRNGRRPDEK